MIALWDMARRLPQWDRSVKLGIALAVALFIPLLALSFGGPESIRLPARVGAFGTLITAQLLFLWANRRDISPYHQAQQHFIAGDFKRARTLLESIPEASRVSVDALVLLGNCYRHLGMYDSSRAALEKALELKPAHHLARFSRGRLCLVEGDYAQAAKWISSALEAGSPDSVRFDLGLANYLLGDFAAASAHFIAAAPHLAEDPPQRLLLEFYLYRINGSGLPSADLHRDGKQHWLDEAAKHETPYGQALRRALAELDADLA